MRFVTGIESDFSDRWLFVAQSPRRALQPKPARELERRFADHAAKHAVEMEGRQTREPRQRTQFERIVEVPGDVFDSRLNGSSVEGAGVRLHSPITLRRRESRCLISVAVSCSSVGPSGRS